MGNALNAVIQVLKDAGEPLHYKEIARRVLDSHLWTTSGKTPEATVSAQLTIHIKKHGKNAKIHRVGPGTFSLNGAPPASETNCSASAPTAANTSNVGQLSFTDAAREELDVETGVGAGRFRRLRVTIPLVTFLRRPCSDN